MQRSNTVAASLKPGGKSVFTPEIALVGAGAAGAQPPRPGALRPIPPRPIPPSLPARSLLLPPPRLFFFFKRQTPSREIRISRGRRRALIGYCRRSPAPLRQPAAPRREGP